MQKADEEVGKSMADIKLSTKPDKQ